MSALPPAARRLVESAQPSTQESARHAFTRSAKARPAVLQHILHVHTLNLGITRRLVSDLTDDQMCAQPHGVVNHPAWSIGHLTVAADAAGRLLGLTPVLPA